MVKLIALLKRKPGMTREEFSKRWLTEHTKLSSRMPGLREYRINIATPRQPEGTGDEPLYDGTAELWWDSIDDMEAAFASDKGVAAGADADLFSDVRIHIYMDEYMVVPGPVRAAPPKRAAKRPAAKKRATKRVTKKKTNRAK
jgi:uncharacterized protein (TIGR02118 family)